MILWRNVSKMEASTPYFEIIYWLVQNIRSAHDIKLFITWAGLSMIYVHPADNVREAISRPAELKMLSFQQFVQGTLKSWVTIEQRGNSSFIWLGRISNFVRKISNSWLWLGKW